jgi:4-methylaminobutanoate oxidase (formaldehyde-forming)
MRSRIIFTRSLGATGAPLRRSQGLPNKRTTATATTTAASAAAAAAAGTTTAIPTHARVVVVGGGIIGTSLAYHLTRHAGFTDVLVLEQHQLTAGTTWHAAGLVVTFGSLSETSTELRKYTRDLYAHVLEAETGQATGFKPVGFIELATDADRLEEYRRIATFNRRCGVDVHEISAAEVQEKFPLCRTDDVLAGFYVAGDGRVNPVDAAMALAKGARSRGARIVEGAAARVVGVTTEPCAASPWERRVTGVRLAGGATVRAEYVVNCAGMWARQVRVRLRGARFDRVPTHPTFSHHLLPHTH